MINFIKSNIVLTNFNKYFLWEKSYIDYLLYGFAERIILSTHRYEKYELVVTLRKKNPKLAASEQPASQRDQIIVELEGCISNKRTSTNHDTQY